MGYFSNGTEHEMYAAQYCVRCRHYDDGGCPVIMAHMVYNYEECNKPDSILHMLIPRAKEGAWNDQCRMFIHDAEQSDED